YITLNRPDAANALNAEVARQLDQAALRCDENPEIRAVLMTGAGRMFLRWRRSQGLRRSASRGFASISEVGHVVFPSGDPSFRPNATAAGRRGERQCRRGRNEFGSRR